MGRRTGVKNSGRAGLACCSLWAPPQSQDVVVPAFSPRTQEADRAPGLQGQTGQYKEFLLGRAAEETLSVKKGVGHKRETEGTEHMHHMALQ